MNGWFITGTDTGVGKTRAAQALLVALAQAGHAAVGMKPIASGAGSTPAGLRHADAEALRAVSGVAADYDDINPYCFAPAVAPHLAAELAGIDIRPEKFLSTSAVCNTAPPSLSSRAPAAGACYLARSSPWRTWRARSGCRWFSSWACASAVSAMHC